MIYWGGGFDFSALKVELAELKIKSEDPKIWKDNIAKPIFQKLKNIEKKIKDFNFINDNLEYIEDLFKIAIAENNEEYFIQLLPETTKLVDISNKSRLENLMSESADPNNIFLEIHAGAGEALGRLAKEDPSFRVTSDEESGQTIIKAKWGHWLPKLKILRI